MNGKAKGSGFERQISKELSLWWSNGERDDLFWRTQSSGGRFTIRKRMGLKTHNQSGDVCSTHPNSELFSKIFHVECKSYKNIGLWSIVTGKGLLVDWLVKAKEEASGGKHVFLVAKENNRPVLVFLDRDIHRFFCVPQKLSYKFSFSLGEDIIYGYLLKDILSCSISQTKMLLESINLKEVNE